MNLREKIEKPVAGVIRAEQKVALFCGKCFLCVQILNYIPDERECERLDTTGNLFIVFCILQLSIRLQGVLLYVEEDDFGTLVCWLYYDVAVGT